MVKKGDIIQITKEQHTWYPCLVVVDEVKKWGVVGYLVIPVEGVAYIRLEKEDFEKVGKVKIGIE